MGQPVKIADDLLLDARTVGKVENRSIAGQIEFWARLGEALEPLLQGIQTVALLKAHAAKPLSQCLETVDSQEGRQRVSDYLQSRSFPHYEPAPHRPGLLTRIEADGTRTIGRFIHRHFTPAD